MNLYERILIPTNLDGFDDLAIRYALLFHERHGSKITMLHAEEVSWLAAEHPIGYYFENANEAKEGLKWRLAEYARRLTPAGASVATIFVDEEPVRGISRIAEETGANLIVMATHGRTGLRRALIGSVTESVLREAEIPVLTVTPRLFAAGGEVALRSILCPVNFSDVAAASLEQAAAIAEAFDAKLIVMHVASDGVRNVEEQLGEWIDGIVRGRVRYRRIVLEGDPAERVLEIADQLQTDLMVIGARHRRFHDSTVTGLTTDRITRFARHAVLTVATSRVTDRAARSATSSEYAETQPRP